jgi:hypothetical protein
MPLAPIGITPASAAGAAAPAPPPKVSFGDVLRRRAAPGPARSPLPKAARAAVESLDRARRGLDTALAAARRGRTFTAQELLALQADAYRYSQVVDVASKVVEEGAQSVKQAVNTQV